jgi:hypothetical protein
MAGKKSRAGFNKKTTKEEEQKGAKHNRRQDILSNKSEGTPVSGTSNRRQDILSNKSKGTPGSGTSRNREIIMTGTGTGAQKKEKPRKASISERMGEHRRRRKAGESTHEVMTKGRGVVARRNPSR